MLQKRIASSTKLAVPVLAIFLAGCWIPCAIGQTTPPTQRLPGQPLIEWHAEPKASTNAASGSTELTAPRFDPTVIPAAHLAADKPNSSPQNQTAAEKPADPRRLAPFSGVRPLDIPGSQNKANLLEDSLPQVGSMTTAGAGLAIVVGLFLLCAWLFRKSGPKPTTPLPKDAVAVLGRVPLASNHFAHLLKLGNKLVLVSVSPDSVSTLAEVSDPVEVQNLMALCMRNHQQSTTAEFHQVLEQLAGEPARGFLDTPAAGATPIRPGRT